MAQRTADTTKMKGAVTELENIYRTMTENKKKLDELIFSLPKVWQGEGADAYLRAYDMNSENIMMLAQAIQSCAATLTAISSGYDKADNAANEAILSNMVKG